MEVEEAEAAGHSDFKDASEGAAIKRAGSPAGKGRIRSGIGAWREERGDGQGRKGGRKKEEKDD